MKKAEWVSSIKLRKIREAQILSCFKCDVEFHYPRNILELAKIMDEFKVQPKAGEITDDANNDNDLDYFSFLYEENKKKRLTYCYG